MGTMTDETYNGYANRETWAFNLHWQNDEGLYNMTLETAQEYLTETYGHDWASLPENELRGAFYGVGEHVAAYWHDLIDTYADEFGAALPEGLAMFRDEVGSWWRIDHAEVGAAVRESLDSEA
jgi:hypothetical protein